MLCVWNAAKSGVRTGDSLGDYLSRFGVTGGLELKVLWNCGDEESPVFGHHMQQGHVDTLIWHKNTFLAQEREAATLNQKTSNLSWGDENVEM